MKVLVTGATGYIGGRLAPRLLERGHAVRVLVRDRGRLAGRPWSGKVEVHEGDLLEPASLVGALTGVDAAVYLVHSMAGRHGDFAAVDRQAAQHFVDAAKGASALRHVVYLGGLQPAADASPHLASRAEVGRVLRAGLATTELRAGPIIGSGSASFEMVRYLTERLPAMVAPRWVRNDVQPIAVRDILAYLEQAVERGSPMGVVPVGADRLTFKAMMLTYAQQRKLRRWLIPVPVLAPRLAARWVGLVTPIPNRLAVPLVEGVVRPLVVEGNRARELFPSITPIPYAQAVRLAMTRIERGQVETRWTSAMGKPVPDLVHEDWEGTIREVRTVPTTATPQQLFDVFTSLGGERGYLVWNWAWWLRGFLDRLIGGPGVRRGRRDPHQLLPGEAVDWWRVEAIQPPHRLRLRAEMKVPGQAWLQWTTPGSVPGSEGAAGEARDAADADGSLPPRTRLIQTAAFEPRGLPGTLYWYGLYPIHHLIFTDMAKAIVREAERRAAAP